MTESPMVPRRRSALAWRLVHRVTLAALLLPAMSLTVLRVWRPWSELGVQAVAFTPLAVPLYAGALVLVLTRAVLAPPRGRWGAVGLAVVLLLALQARWLAPQFSGDRPEAAAGATPVTVLTVNLWHGQVGGLKVLQAARRADADILVLSEIRPKELVVMENGGIGEDWPHRVGETDVDIAGTMVFSRFPLTDAVRLPTRLGAWSTTVAAPDAAWRLVGAHVASPVDAGEWRTDHEAVRAAAADADLVVGDLNATADHRPVQRLAALGLRDAVELTNAGWQPTWPANGEFRLAGLLALPPLVQIDHVLVGAGVAVESVETVTLQGTDHLGVLAVVAAR